MRSQITMEFIVLISIGLVGLMVVIIIAGNQIKEMVDGREYILTRDKALELQNELYIAAQVHDGYNRTFYLPEDLEGIKYAVKLTQNTLILNSSRYEHVLRIPVGITGNITKGWNTITQTGGKIDLSPPS
ncbi:MAG: hypothetical protein V1735_07840 [Nanoarchaeota archaeon]